MPEQKNIIKQKRMINMKTFSIAIIFLIIIIVGGIFIVKGGDTASGINKERNILSNDEGLVIPIKDISSTASFYPVVVNGTTMEVLAVEAPDGTIRTAFNTCQVCYSSGKGYYVQDADVLVCQNCGNRFELSEIEITRGGCNPVPIFSDEKTVDSETITISNEFLKESKEIFATWKTDY